MRLSYMIFSMLAASALAWGVSGGAPASVVPAATARPASAPIFLRTHSEIGPKIKQGSDMQRAQCHITGHNVDITTEAPGLVWLPTPYSLEDTLVVSCSTKTAEGRPDVAGQVDFAPVNLTLRRKMQNVPIQTSVPGLLLYWQALKSLKPDPKTDVYAYTHVLSVVMRPLPRRTPL